MEHQEPEPTGPWYVTLFERDWFDLLAPGGARAADPASHQEATAREVAFIAETLALPAGARVLDLCCGWGRHARRLAQSGLRLVGLDRSLYHLRLAAERDADHAVAWLAADMRHLPLTGASLDAVINMFTSFGYFDDEGNQQVLAEVARVLRPGGRLLLDLINRDYLMGVFQRADWDEASDGLLTLERRRWDAATGRIHAEWTLIDKDGERRTHRHDERIYTLQELELRLAAADLNVIDAFGGYDGSALSRSSRRLIVLAERA
jgi:ubiquinone/menaquinone biosynthesis C-methylase UbiE